MAAYVEDCSPIGLPTPPSALLLVSLAALLGLPSLCPFPPSTLSGPTPYGLGILPQALAWSLTGLRPCFSAGYEHLRALHDAGMDEHDLTSGSPAKAVSLVDEPLVDNQLLDFGAVRECSFEAGFRAPRLRTGSFLFPASPASWLPRPS